MSFDCIRLRPARWGQVVNIYDDLELGKPNATAREIQTAQDTLLQILALFAESESILKKYKIDVTADEDLTPISDTDMHPNVLAL